jgi:hypothetical protein
LSNIEILQDGLHVLSVGSQFRRLHVMQSSWNFASNDISTVRDFKNLIETCTRRRREMDGLSLKDLHWTNILAGVKDRISRTAW